jgi:hypothetical protein
MLSAAQARSMLEAVARANPEWVSGRLFPKHSIDDICFHGRDHLDRKRCIPLACCVHRTTPRSVRDSQIDDNVTHRL